MTYINKHHIHKGIREISAELLELQKRYELITINIAASVIIQNLEGHILFCSPYTQVLSGYCVDDIIKNKANGKDLLKEQILEQDLGRYQRALEVSRLGEDILVRYKIKHKSGLFLWLESRMVPVFDERGDVKSVMSVTIDVTDTLNYQEQIEAQNRDLNDFTYMVSHDLKAPVFTIKGMASALMEDCEKYITDDAKNMLKHIIQASNRLEKLVSSVIEYSSINSKELLNTDVALDLVCANVLDDLSEMIKIKNVSISLQEKLPVIHADQIRVYQVFSNLIGNAIKYSHPERAPEIKISCLSQQIGRITIEIKDNGRGIPETDIQRIFRPYARVSNTEVEGSGIGLACVQKIMNKLGGEVSVQSILGEGSTFSVTFPCETTATRQIPEDLAKLFE